MQAYGPKLTICAFGIILVSIILEVYKSLLVDSFSTSSKAVTKAFYLVQVLGLGPHEHLLVPVCGKNR